MKCIPVLRKTVQQKDRGSPPSTYVMEDCPIHLCCSRDEPAPKRREGTIERLL